MRASLWNGGGAGHPDRVHWIADLFLDSEHHGRTAHEKIFVVRAGSGSGLAGHELQVLIHAAQAGDRERMLELLSELVAAVEEPNAPG